MEEHNPVDQAIAATNSPMASASKVINSMSSGWTDETHRLYLDSVEASFVKKLYSSEYNSNDMLGWLSSTQTQTNSYHCHPKNQSLGQDKNEKELRNLAGNPWIQHFRSDSTTQVPHMRSASPLEGSNVIDHSANFVDSRNGREATSSRWSPPSPSPYSHKIHKVSIGGITEFSDQNFVDEKHEKEEVSSGRRGKKRARSTVSRCQITDQVVPLASPTSNDKTTLSKENAEEFIRKNFVHKEPYALLSKTQQTNDPNLEGG